MKVIIGLKIKELRTDKGITQKELANALGVTEQAISRWENQTCSPDLSLIVPIARYFSVSTDELFGNRK